MPVAKKFGDDVYEIAAKSPSKSGVQTTAAQLKQLADEIQSPEGRIRVGI